MSALGWVVAVALLITVGADLAVSWRIWRWLRTEPARRTQRELRDRLRTLSTQADRELHHAAGLLRSGAPLPPEAPRSTTTATADLDPLCRRLADPDVARSFQLTAERLAAVAVFWDALGDGDTGRANLLAAVAKARDDLAGQLRRLDGEERALRA